MINTYYTYCESCCTVDVEYWIKWLLNIIGKQITPTYLQDTYVTTCKNIANWVYIVAENTAALHLEKSITFAIYMQKGLFVLSIQVLEDDFVKYMGALTMPKSMQEEYGIVQ